MREIMDLLNDMLQAVNPSDPMVGSAVFFNRILS